MQNASLSTLIKSSHQRQKKSLKSKISFFFLKFWCKHVEHSSANPMKRYAKNEKNFGLKVQKIRIFLANSYVSLHKFLWTREMQFPRHWRDTFAKSPQRVHSGSKNAAKSYNLFWKKRFFKKIISTCGVQSCHPWRKFLAIVKKKKAFSRSQKNFAHHSEKLTK